MQPRTVPLSLLALGAIALAGSATAQNANEAIPLKRVVLFNSGVGFFERSAQIQGNAAVELSFRAEQINDILKSLVLFDPQGSVRPVTYTTRDAHVRRLYGIGRGIDGTVSLGVLLRRFQGARVRLETGAEGVEGRIVSVSLKTVPVKDTGVLQAEVLNVLTEGGLRAVPLEQVTQIRLLDETLDRELRESLEALATGLDDQRKRVELRFTGNAPREVRAAYLQEMPIWKTSYRLVLGNEKPYLQGWAQVENTTDEDWKEVHLGLVSGRPISFIQELYQPLFVPRPVIQAQVVGSPLPQTYGEVLEREAAVAPAEAPGGGFGGLGGFGGGGVSGVSAYPGAEAASERRINLNLQGTPLRLALARLFAGTGLQYSVDPNIPNLAIDLQLRDVTPQQALRLIIRQAASSVPGLTSSKEGDVYVIKTRQQSPTALGSTPEAQGPPPEFVDQEQFRLASQAQGVRQGELFEYAIRQPVTLARGKAAMVPIISETVEGERLSIFDGSGQEEHALHGFRLKNTSGLHLAGGPITVFRDGTYAGDAQIAYLGPGEERLISYAVDLDLVAERRPEASRLETLSVTARSGVLHVTRKHQSVRTYTFRNKTDGEKLVLVQQAIEPGFKLVSPEKAFERTPAEYRFRVAVPAGKTAELKVITEAPAVETVALVDANVNLILAYARNGEVPETLRAALKQLAERRQTIANLQSRQSDLEKEIQTIDREQSRIRLNMAQLDRNNPLYQQYVKKLSEQETRIEKVRTEIAVLRERIHGAEEELRKFVDGITVDDAPEGATR